MRFKAGDMQRDKREALLEWLQGEGLVAGDILDDGRFTVHGGLISGNKIIRDENGEDVIRNGRIAHYHFLVEQKNPLPEILVGD